MKKLLVVSAVAVFGVTSVAFAGGLPEEVQTTPVAISSETSSSLYLGISGGYGMTNWKNQEGNKVGKVSSDKCAVGRVFLGADLTRHVALEGGYTYFFSKPKFKNTADVEQDKVKNTQAIDLMLKLKAPVADNFDLYGKIGANYLMSNFNKASNVKNFNVAYGAGAEYYITSNIAANVEWLRFNGKAKAADKDYQPSTDAFMIGVRYLFNI